MVSEKNDKNIERVQYLIAVVCLIVGFGSVAVVGMYAAGRYGGESDIYVVPKMIGVTSSEEQLERAYVEEALIMLGDIDGAHVAGVVVLEVGERLEGDSTAVAGVLPVDSVSAVSVAQWSVDSLIPAAVLVSVESPPPTPPVEKPKVKVIGPLQKPVAKQQVKEPITVDEMADAQMAIRNREYYKAMRALEFMPRTDEVVYWRARAVFGLFKKEQATAAQVMALWRDVRSVNAPGSKRYNEADSILELFR